MKTRMTMLMSLAIAGMIFSGCGNDDDHDAVSGVVEKAFNSKYPGVSTVEWEKHGDYSEVDFVYQKMSSEAWFYKDGNWLLTISDIAYSALPQAVTTALNSGLYASWTPDKQANIFEQATAAVWYIVEVSKTGESDRELYFLADGEMHKEVTEEYDRNELPGWMNTFLKKNYPHAYYLLGEEMSDGRFTLYLFQGKRMGTVYFFRDQTWEYTTYPISEEEVPGVVMAVLGGEAFEGYQIRSVDYREAPAGKYYYFDLYKSGSLDMKVKISPDGQLLLN